MKRVRRLLLSHNMKMRYHVGNLKNEEAIKRFVMKKLIEGKDFRD